MQQITGRSKIHAVFNKSLVDFKNCMSFVKSRSTSNLLKYRCEIDFLKLLVRHTPDISICIEGIHSITKRTVGNQLGGSDHRPVCLNLDTKITITSTMPRWTYEKADWKAY